MDYLQAVRRGFLDELEKIGVSKKLVSVAQSRGGRRPLRVSTLLKKEKEGTFYKKFAEGSLGNSVPFADGDAPGVTGKAAKAPKSSSDVPSREDGRENVQVIPAVAKFLLATDAVNHPEERTNT